MKIKDIFRVTRGSVLAADKVLLSKIDGYEYPVYSSQTKADGLLGYYNTYLYENAITWTTDGANAGTVHYRAGKFYCTNVCGVLLNKDGYANRCTAAILGSISKKYVSYVGNPKLMNNIMSEIPIIIPALEEQHKIDSFIAVLDKRIKAQQMMITSLKKYKRGAIQKLFSETDMEQWNLVKLKDVVKVFDGTHQTPNYKTTGVRFISVENILDPLATQKYISEDDYRKEFKVHPEYGDVLMTRIGDIGRTYYVNFDSDMAYYVSLALFKCSPKIEGRFLAAYISTNTFQKELWERTLHIAFPKKINTGEIGECSIRLPSRERQIAIASYLDVIEKKIRLAEKKLDLIQIIKTGLMQQLFI